MQSFAALLYALRATLIAESVFGRTGNTVAFFDPSTENSTTLVESAKKSKTVQEKDVQRCASLKELAESMPAGQRVFVFSLPHGSVADKIIDELEPLVDPGDVRL